MVCGSSSRLIQVPFSPDFTVKVLGLKAKSLISILFCLLLSAFFISPPSAKRDRLRKAMPHKSAAILYLGVSVIIIGVDLAQVGIDNGEGSFALFVLDVR